jgi:thiol:disulfide interchange protein DsbA
MSMMDAYNVEFWPYLAVDGKYVTAPSMALANASTEAQLNEAVTQVLDVLVTKAKAEKK